MTTRINKGDESVRSSGKPPLARWATPKGGVALTGTPPRAAHGASVVPSGVHAVMGIDPGGTTGVAAGHFRLHATAKRTLTDGRRSWKTTEVRGDWWTQAKAIAELINRFVFTAQTEHELAVGHVHIAWENYTRRPQAATTNLDSVWVMAAALAFLDRPELDHAFQEPSSAKGYAENQRLRGWGIYVVGSDHERDAARHVALRVSDLISGKPNKPWAEVVARW